MDDEVKPEEVGEEAEAEEEDDAPVIPDEEDELDSM